MSSGFQELHERDDWPYELPDKFFVTRSGRAIIAISKRDVKSDFLLEADSQSPSLKVFPGTIFRADCEQTFVHPVGAVL
jgi:aspartyl aminopeptidase